MSPRNALSRRTALAAGLALAGLQAFPSRLLAETAPEAAETGRSPAFEKALAAVLGSRTPEEGKIGMDMPEFAENGNTVPYKIEVESPMTDADYVTRLHLLSTANPQPTVATFHFTPLSGRAAVTGRMRLARSQDVVAVAETSTGALLIGTVPVKVTIGGCGNE